MKKYLLLLLAALALAGCQQRRDGETTAYNGGEYRVGYMFTHDGCKVYRFSDGDGSSWRYFVKCSDGQAGDTFWSERSSKTSRDVYVQSGQGLRP